MSHVHYPHYPTRRSHRLDGVWQASWLGDAELAAVDASAIAWHERLPVPGCFDAEPAHAGARGVMAYRRLLSPTPGSAAVLHIGALGLRARILVDGVELTTWDLPYSGLHLAVPASSRGHRELVILVDNRFDVERMPLMHQWYDFYAYGGIYRSVVWDEVGSWWIERAAVRIEDAATGRIAVELSLAGTPPALLDLRWSCDCAEPLALNGLAVDDGRVRFAVQVPEPRLWSPDDPHLHHLRVEVDGDSIVERFGLRTVTTRGEQVLLNGQPVKLLGYCRHEVHPQYGPALPLQQLVDDLQHLRRLGCNFIRGSHYPQDQRFLDLCDELGFLVFEESLGWGYDEALFARPAFQEANRRQTALMAANSHNHPCIVLWGFLNEGGSHQEAERPLYESLIAILRDRDDGRLVTYASNRIWEGKGDRFLDLVDVVCLNLYPGWYARDQQSVAPLAEVVPVVRQAQEQAADLGGAGKPFIVSEIGAGAIPGWHDPLAGHWSEEYQASLLEAICTEVVGSERIAGISIWQFCDCRTYATARALGRPRTFNNKGTLDEYRRPKLAYATVRRIFAGG